MQQAEREFDALGVRVLVVTFEPPWAARAYVEETGTRWPVLCDEARMVYQAYGMDRARWRHLLGPSALFAYAREIARGRLPRWPTADSRQQGGNVLIDPAGIVRLVHVGAGPGHRPPVERLLEARRAAGPAPAGAACDSVPGEEDRRSACNSTPHASSKGCTARTRTSPR